MKILVFGHLPTWAGGLQNSGLANVIYWLSKSISDIDGVVVTLAATDSFVKMRTDGNLRIIGWTKEELIWFLLSHPVLSLLVGYRLYKLKSQFRVNESFWGLFFKRLFFFKSVGIANPDIIHLHDPAAIWFLDLIPEHIKVCITFHGLCGTDKNRSESETLFKIEKELFHDKRIDTYFFICSLLVHQFINTYGRNSKPNIVIYNSYDNKKFFYSVNTNNLTTSSIPIKLCTIASLSDRKGQIRVLQALAQLKDKDQFMYFCIGDDVNNYSSQLIEYAKLNQISFEYLGRMEPDDVRINLSSFDYMIMPSSSEGFGLTYLESIACGVPVILPKDLPIAFEETLIKSSNSILLDDCGVEAIIQCLMNIKKHHFNKEEVSKTLNNLSWELIGEQYYREFSKLV